MILAHKIRLCPTSKQEEYFRRACGTTRFTYNYALAEWKRQYLEGEKPNGQSLRKEFNAIRRKEFPWTYDVHRDCTSRVFDTLQIAFNRFFSGVSSFPTFKKKGEVDSFYVANDQFRMTDDYVRLPRIGKVKIREPLRWSGKIMNATVSRQADAWFIAVQVEVGEIKRPRIGDGVVGIDLGIKTTTTLSTGEKIDGPKALRTKTKKERRLSKDLTRKEYGSKNWEKARMKLSRFYRHITWVRNDFLNKLTTKLVSENQAIGIENLNVQGLLKNHSIARSIQDEGWGEFKRQLLYKSSMYGTEVVIAERFFPSTKTCSCCGYINKELTLKDRSWVCPECKTEHDRDINAAKNLVPWVTRDVKPVEKKALAGRAVRPVKLSSGKQEFQRLQASEYLRE